MNRLDASVVVSETKTAIGDCAKPDKVNNMEPWEFHGRLERLGLSLNGLASITGVNPRTVLRWDDGEQDIPKWVEPFLNLIAASCPPKIAESRHHYRGRLEDLLSDGASFYEGHK